jgi:hypothetical protein
VRPADNLDRRRGPLQYLGHRPGAVRHHRQAQNVRREGFNLRDRLVQRQPA